MERIFRTTDFIRRAAMLLLLLVTTGLRSMDNGRWAMVLGMICKAG